MKDNLAYRAVLVISMEFWDLISVLDKFREFDYQSRDYCVTHLNLFFHLDSIFKK